MNFFMLFTLLAAYNTRYVLALCISSLVCISDASAQTNPAGLWQSVDDSSGKPRAQIRISESNGVFTGVIERSLLPLPANTIPRCDLCTDDRKGQPMLGMQIIRGIRSSAQNAALWEGGEILDPDKGKTYSLQLRLLAEGKQLQVRGLIGPFFRNQTWIRLE
jgi:uncharacterized protein (DUF2147 family)